MEPTKGEWRLESGRIVSGYMPEVALIAELNEDEYEDVVTANAYLITSAPNMYQVLKHAETVLYNLKVSKLGELTQQQALLELEIRKVLAKAEGKL